MPSSSLANFHDRHNCLSADGFLYLERSRENLSKSCTVPYVSFDTILYHIQIQELCISL